jgi:hypothetical protein
MLLIQLTNLAGEGQSFLDKDFRVMNSGSKLPLLWRRARPNRIETAGAAKVEA